MPVRRGIYHNLLNPRAALMDSAASLNIRPGLPAWQLDLQARQAGDWRRSVWSDDLA